MIRYAIYGLLGGRRRLPRGEVSVSARGIEEGGWCLQELYHAWDIQRSMSVGCVGKYDGQNETEEAKARRTLLGPIDSVGDG